MMVVLVCQVLKYICIQMEIAVALSMPMNLTDSVTVDSSGFYQFVKYPEKTVEDNFDNGSGDRSCSNGTDGDTPWATNWADANDPSAGFCNNSQTAANTDVDIFTDAAFGYAMRLKDNDVSARRSVNLNAATKAFLTFSYRRKSATLTAGEDVLVQASTNGVAFTTILYNCRKRDHGRKLCNNL